MITLRSASTKFKSIFIILRIMIWRILYLFGYNYHIENYKISAYDQNSNFLTFRNSKLNVRKNNFLKNTSFFFHIGDGMAAAFHVDLWYNYIRSVDPNALIVIRSLRLFAHLCAARPELNLYYVRSGREAEVLVKTCPNLKAVLYASNTGNTIHFLRFNHVRHVIVGHGDSDKAASSYKFFRAYDEVWTAGRAHIDRFRNAGFEHDSLQFRIVGRPRARDLIQAHSMPPQDKRRFLYLPTWEGFQAEQDYSSAALGVKFIHQVADLCKKEVSIKLHPWTGTVNKSLKDSGKRILWNCKKQEISAELATKDTPVETLMQEVDFLISDVSSVVTDFLCTNKPIFLFIPKNRNILLSHGNINVKDYCYIFSNIDELLYLVKRIIVDDDDILISSRSKARDYYIDIRRTVEKQFEQELESLRSNTPSTKAWPASSRTSQNVVASGGGKGPMPLNSLASFAKIVGGGIEGVELDIHLSADGQPVILHDPVLDRTCNGHGPVSLQSLEVLRHLKLTESDETIPQLDEVLALLASSPLELYVKLNVDYLGQPYEGVIEKVLSSLTKHHVLDRSLLTSFNVDTLEDARHLNSGIRLLLLVNMTSAASAGGLKNLLARAKRIAGCEVAVEVNLSNSAKDIILSDEIITGIWNVSEKNDLNWWMKHGIRKIFTDNPNLALLARELHGSSSGVRTEGQA